jgi:hypothetical protein
LSDDDDDDEEDGGGVSGGDFLVSVFVTFFSSIKNLIFLLKSFLLSLPDLLLRSDVVVIDAAVVVLVDKVIDGDDLDTATGENAWADP